MTSPSFTTPFEIRASFSLPLNPEFVEYPDVEEETVPYSGSGFGGGFRPVSLETDRFILLSPFFTVRREKHVPHLLKKKSGNATGGGEHEAQKDLALTHLDLGAGALTGIKTGLNSHLALFGAIEASRYNSADPNPSAEVDRYGNYENPADQGGFPLPLQHENTHPKEGLTSKFKAGGEIKLGLARGNGGPAVHLGGAWETHIIATTNKGTLHLNAAVIFAAGSYSF